MRAKVRSLFSHEVDDGEPKDPSHADVLVEVFAGPADGPGEEQFQVEVVTLSALQARVEDGGFLLGRHLLITRIFDSDAVSAFLRARFEEPEAATWSELAEKLGRIGRWEFEDYRA